MDFLFIKEVVIFCADSEVTDHITGDLSILTSVRWVTDHPLLRVANANLLDKVGMGDVSSLVDES